MHNWDKLEQWWKKSGRRTFPWRKNRTPWRVFVAEILLRRTRAEAVGEIYLDLIREFPTPVSVLTHKSEWLEKVHSLGFRKRYEQFFKACEEISTKYSGKVPVNEKELWSLPGIGHYSTDAIRCFGFNERRYLVDTNTIRIASRLTGEQILQEKHRSKETREQIAIAFGPEENMTASINFALLDLAAQVCTPTSPECGECPIYQNCEYSMNRREN